MTAQRLHHQHHRPGTLLAVVTALLLAVALVPMPAHAHDTLISTDPEDGAVLETSPEQITLTFSADVLDVSPVVRISDDSGEVLEEITPTIDGPAAIAEPSEPLPAGTHTVEWRVVSSDGHPIEGTFTITVEQGPEDGVATASDGGGADAAGDQATSEESAAASDGGAESAAADSSDDQQAAAEEDSDSILPLLLGIIAVAAVGVVIAGIFARRRRG